MTAAELYELVTRPSPGLPDGWPDGARPESLWYSDDDDDVCPIWADCPSDPMNNQVRLTHAALLHEASAARLLGEVRDYDGSAHGVLIQYGPWVGGEWRATLMGRDHYGPTLLHAYDAAIRAVGGE